MGLLQNKKAIPACLFINGQQVDPFALNKRDSNYKHRLVKFPAIYQRK